VSSNNDWTVVSGDDIWINLSNDSGSGNGTISFDIEENTSTDNRSTYIYVEDSFGNSENITIDQDGAPAYINVSPTYFSVPYNSSNGEIINVSSNNSWSASCNDSWITITTASGNNDGSIDFDISENTSTDSRNTYIYVEDSFGNYQTVNIDQDGAPSYISANPTSFSFDYNSQNGQSISISSNDTWNASCNDSWINIQTSNGTGNGPVDFDVEENTDTSSSRSTTIEISTNGGESVSVTIDQDPAPVQLDASPQSFSFDSSSHYDEYIDITSNTSWSAYSNESWILVNTSSGTGNGSVDFNVEENTDQSQRSGSIVISDDDGNISITVTIDQDGAVI